MINDDNFEKAVELIGKSDDILITTHVRPDGDACGVVVAIRDAMAALGKKAKVLLLSKVPKWYEFLFAEKPSILGKDVTLEELMKGRLGKADLIVIVDTNSYSQLPGFAKFLKQNEKPVLVIDHHVTTDGLSDVELIDTSAAATSLIVLDLFEYAGWRKNAKIAEALFVAIATDTGWFQFGNTDSRVFRGCAELIEAGANPERIYHDLYQNYSAERFRLMAKMLNTLELHFDGRFATQYLRLQDFEQAGAAFNDTENLIDECRRIHSVESAALFVELEDGRVKCSLRSRGAIDVRKIAQKFGGGGHTNAAGIHLPGPLEEAIELIKGEVEKEFQQPADN